MTRSGSGTWTTSASSAFSTSTVASGASPRVPTVSGWSRCPTRMIVWPVAENFTAST